MKCPKCGSTDVVKKHVPDEKIGPITIRSSCGNCKSEGNVTHCCSKCSSYLCSKCAGSACFVATACYGCYDAPEVLVLRRFRDETLMSSARGCRIVNLYYRMSPPLARWLEHHPLAAKAIRSLFLNPVAALLGRRQR